MGKTLRYTAVWALVLIGAVACSHGEDPAQARAHTPKGMVYIPAGPFIMGSNKVDKDSRQRQYGFVQPLYLNEHPRHKVDLKAFYIDRYEVTNGQYKRFTRETNRPVPVIWIQNGYNVRKDKLKTAEIGNLRWVARTYFRIDRDPDSMSRKELLDTLSKIQHFRDSLPVTGVNWYDARAYCKWAGKRLPTEAEWEKTARGTDGQEFPWGNKWNEHYPNTGADSRTDTPLAPVGSYPHDKSPYGVYDMGGNVTEWVSDWYAPYPGSTYKSKFYGKKQKVARGGASSAGHYALSLFYRTARRAHAKPSMISTDVGFRCAQDTGGEK